MCHGFLIAVELTLVMCLTRLRPLVKSSYQKIIFSFLNQNIYCGYSKKPSHYNCSFEHPKHLLKLIGIKKYLQFYAQKFVDLNL